MYYFQERHLVYSPVYNEYLKEKDKPTATSTVADIDETDYQGHPVHCYPPQAQLMILMKRTNKGIRYIVNLGFSSGFTLWQWTLI
jgi:hypothetical protein